MRLNSSFSLSIATALQEKMPDHRTLYLHPISVPSPTCRQKLFDFNPPFLQRSESLTPPAPLAPLHFLDRHISESLILKRLKVVPSLHVDLLNVLTSFSQPLDTLQDLSFNFHTTFSYERIETADALSIIQIREKGVERASARIASSLILHPSQPDFSGLLKWLNADRAIKPTLVNEEYCSQNLTLHVWDISSDKLKALNRKNREMYTRLHATHADQLASCMIFCTDGLSVMEDMTRLDAVDVFPWRLDSHYSGTSSTQTPPPDAPDPLWTLPTTEGPRRSRRVRIQLPSQRATSRDIGLIDHGAEKTDEYVPQCEDYIQKVISLPPRWVPEAEGLQAWVAAVKIDASLILFDCGNFVRIGIRHRELQTLFLSDLIDICSCKDPSYGELWTALHIAVASDAVQRALQLENPRLGKRKQTSATTNRSKRRKLDNVADLDRVSVDSLYAAVLSSISSKWPNISLHFPRWLCSFASVTLIRLLPFFSYNWALTAGPVTSQRIILVSLRTSHSGQVRWETYIVLSSNPPARPTVIVLSSSR